MSFIPSPKMSLCLCSLFLAWRLNLPLHRQRLFCVVTHRKESLKSNPGCSVGCSADRPRRHVSPSCSCFLSDFFVKRSFLAVAESNQPRGAFSQTREEIKPRSISTKSNTRMWVKKVCFHTVNKISEILIPACGDQLQMHVSKLQFTHWQLVSLNTYNNDDVIITIIMLCVLTASLHGLQLNVCSGSREARILSLIWW